jgi:predicted glycosyltransferase
MPHRARVMFVSSNGTGLGHLTRSMAIARRLDREIEPLFVTLSRAAPEAVSYTQLTLPTKA